MCQHVEDLADVIPAYFPVDGPHSDETISEAAAAVSGLVRYLNHATLDVTSPAMAWAATSGRVIGGISAAMYGLDQLLRQLGGAMYAQAANPRLYDDRRDRAAAGTTAEVRHYLDLARQSIALAATALNSAHGAASHLGNND